MPRKLHKFQTVAEYQAYSASTDYTTPCVAVVEENNVIYYDYGDNKPHLNYTDFKVSSRSLVSDGGNTYGLGEKLCLNYIPSDVTSLEDAFSYWPNLEEVTCKIPDGVTNMNSTFYYCTSLVIVPVIPSGVTSIVQYAFKYCTSLTSVTIPNAVRLIDKEAFYGCSGLTSVTIGSGVTDIENSAFEDCSGLTSITVNTITPPTIGYRVFDNTNDCPIYVPSQSVEAYKAATRWSAYASRIKPISEKP